MGTEEKKENIDLKLRLGVGLTFLANRIVHLSKSRTHP